MTRRGGMVCKSALVTPDSYRHHLPQLSEQRPFVTDGGLETDLIFNRGIELPEFAAFVLLEDPEGMQALRDYYDGFFAIARDHRAGFILDTPTCRANPTGVNASDTTAPGSPTPTGAGRRWWPSCAAPGPPMYRSCLTGWSARAATATCRAR